MSRIITITFFIILFALTASFSAINADAVTINYYLGQLSMPVSVLVIVSLVIGTLLGAVIILMNTLRLSYDNKRLSKQLSLLEKEVDNLRVISDNNELKT